MTAPSWALVGASAAQPLTESQALPVSPLFAALVMAVAVLATGLAWPPRKEQVEPSTPQPADSWAGSLRSPQWATRAVAVALLFLSIAAGRLGSESELENLAPALVIGAAWPLLLLSSALVGAVWRWIDPWDGLARLLQRREPAQPSDSDVRWAVVPAVAWMWYLTAFPDTLSPRSVGTALAVYTIVTLMGCLAVGRREWMSRAEVFGLTFGWAARLPLGQLGAWRPPRGTEVVLGVLGGGFLFGAIRASGLWPGLSRATPTLATVGLLAACTIVAVSLGALAVWATRREAQGSVAAAAVPLVVALGLGLALARGRLLVSLQLLPRLASDPFGRGWDLFGTATAPLPTNPLDPGALAATQVLLLLAGGLAGAVVAARRAARGGREPALAGAALFSAIGAAAFAAT